MKLRWRIAIILIGMTLALILGISILSTQLLMGNAKRLEEARVHTEMSKVVKLLESELDGLTATTSDWALWDETYEYVQGRDPEYIERNYFFSAFSKLGVDYALIFDEKGTLIYNVHMSRTVEGAYDIEPDLRSYFVDTLYHALPEFSNPGDAVNDIVLFGDRPLLFSAYGITDSLQSEAPKGTLIFCEEITPDLIRQYESFVGAQLNFDDDLEGVTRVVGDLPLDISKLKYSFGGFDITPERVTGKAILYDYFGKEACVLSVTQNREISAQNAGLMQLFTYATILIILTAAFFNSYLIGKLVIRPIEAIGGFLNHVNLERLSGMRLKRIDTVLGTEKGEIGTLVEKTDQMLDRIESDSLRLRDSERRIAQALGASRAGLWEYDIETDTIHLDPRTLSMLRYELETNTFKLTDLRLFLEEEDLKLLDVTFDQVIQGNENSVNLECRIRTGDGQQLWHLITGDLVDEEDSAKPRLVSGLILNIDRQKRMEEELRFLSYHDKLTGLYNRRYFEKMIREYEDPKYVPFAILIADINGLKLTNDTFGHEEGDLLLMAAAKVIRNACRKGDIICRWGGDEFGVLLPGSDEGVAERIYASIKKECEREQIGPIALNIALGYAARHHGEEPLTMLLKTAEERMYRNKMQESESSRTSILNTIQKSLHEKSLETYEHMERVAAVCRAIARELGLGTEALGELELLARLHDIGIITVPESILLKTGRLTEAEWEVVKTHPEIGYRIASTLHDFNHVAPEILSHHEHYDGSGYPKGIRGDQIPLHARILSVADAVDSMLREKPYRKAMTPAEAVTELRRCSGTQFDPVVVEAMLKVMEKGTGTMLG